MIKKQHITVLVILAVLLTGIAIFGKQYLSKLAFNSRFHTCTNQDGTTFETTEPCKSYLPKETDSSINLEYDESPNVELTTYQGKYFSTKYPKKWYEWFFGTGVSLDVFQVNSFSQDQASDLYAEGSFITINVETNDYRPVSTLEGKIDSIKEMNNSLNDDKKIIYQVGQFKSVPALYSEKKSDSHGSNNASYINTIWLIKNDIVYEIKWIVTAKNMNNLENIISRDKPVYNQIINSFEFK